MLIINLSILNHSRYRAIIDNYTHIILTITTADLPDDQRLLRGCS